MFQIFQICAILDPSSQKAASAAGGEAGMDYGTALATLVARRCGGAPSRVHAPGAGRRPPRVESQRKVAILDSFASPGFDFLPNDLDFPSPGFENLSTHFGSTRLSRETTPLALALIELRAAGEGAPLREGGARRFKMCECGRGRPGAEATHSVLIARRCYAKFTRRMENVSNV